jgi:hypothetical protein
MAKSIAMCRRPYAIWLEVNPLIILVYIHPRSLFLDRCWIQRLRRWNREYSANISRPKRRCDKSGEILHLVHAVACLKSAA